MTAREQLIQEIEQVSDAIVEEVLDFCLFVKQRQQSRETVQSRSFEHQTDGVLERNMLEALAYDKHFEQAGFVAMLRE